MTMLLRCHGRFTVSRFIRGAVFALMLCPGLSAAQERAWV